MRWRWPMRGPMTVPGVANARAKAERKGRNPAAKGSPGRRVSDATSVIVLFDLLTPASSGPGVEGWRSLPDPTGSGEVCERQNRTGPKYGENRHFPLRIAT